MATDTSKTEIDGKLSALSRDLLNATSCCTDDYTRGDLMLCMASLTEIRTEFRKLQNTADAGSNPAPTGDK